MVDLWLPQAVMDSSTLVSYECTSTAWIGSRLNFLHAHIRDNPSWSRSSIFSNSLSCVNSAESWGERVERTGILNRMKSLIWLRPQRNVFGAKSHMSDRPGMTGRMDCLKQMVLSYRNLTLELLGELAITTRYPRLLFGMERWRTRIPFVEPK